MPYIDAESKDRIGPFFHPFTSHMPDGDMVTLRINAIRTPGDLTYAITMLVIAYLKRKGITYTHLNDCRGAMLNASTEFYRRVVVKYECKKIYDNGDIFPKDMT